MLGKQLKFIREQKGYSQAQIAESLGTTRQTISNWENDKTILDSASLIRLADFYQISLDELCGRKAPSISKDSLDLLCFISRIILLIFLLTF